MSLVRSGVDAVLALGETIVGLDTSPAGLLVLGADGAVVLLESETWHVRWRIALAAGPLVGRGGFDGDRILIGTTTGAVLLDPRDGRPGPRIDGGWSEAVAWSEGGQAAVALGRHAAVVDADGAPIWSAEASSTVTGLAWIGRRLAVASYGGVVLHEPKSGRVAQTMPFKGSLLSLVVSPNGRWVVTGNQDATLHAWRVGRDNADLAMHGYPTKITSLAFSADSRFLACNGSAELSVWDFAGQGPSGTTPRIVRGHEELVETLAFAPSGHRLASAGRDGAVLVADCGRAIPGRPVVGRPLAERQSPATHVLWLDDDRVVCGFADGVVEIHDAAQVLPR
jgi:WD40 repeat protein